MKGGITISVVIPVYNVSACIERCIQSVMNQTFTDFECILVDDCGTDDGMAKCERMIAEYHGAIRFRILHHQQNRGLSAARNTGTEAATGDYILYIDSDDAITNDCIEKLIAPVLRDSSIDMVIGNDERFVFGTQQSFFVKRRQRNDLMTREAVRQFYFDKNGINVEAWNKLIRKDLLNQHGITFKEGLLWEDNLWTFYVMKYLNHLYIIEDVTYFKYNRPDSIGSSTNVCTQIHYMMQIYYDISSHLTPNDGNREARYYVKRFCCHCVDNSHDELYQKITHNFRKELSVIHNPFDCLLLTATDMMGKFGMCKEVFHCMRRIYQTIDFNI